MTRQKVVRIANPEPKGKTRNPGLLVTLSPATAAANPQKGNHKMKHKKGKGKAKNPKAVGAAGKPKPKPKQNPTTLVIHKHQAKPAKPKRSNPTTLFGRSFQPIELAKVFFGGLVGVAFTKLVAARMPAELTNSPTTKVLTSGAIAFGAGYAAMKADPDFGAAMLFGGGMQTVSVALNGFLPEFAPRLALQGMGDLTPIGGYNMPFNPFTQVTASAAAQALPPASDSAAAFIPSYESTLYQ